MPKRNEDRLSLRTIYAQSVYFPSIRPRHYKKGSKKFNDTQGQVLTKPTPIIKNEPSTFLPVSQVNELKKANTKLVG
jgi:hypothetical protein